MSVQVCASNFNTRILHWPICRLKPLHKAMRQFAAELWQHGHYFIEGERLWGLSWKPIYSVLVRCCLLGIAIYEADGRHLRRWIAIVVHVDRHRGAITLHGV